VFVASRHVALRSRWGRLHLIVRMYSRHILALKLLAQRKRITRGVCENWGGRSSKGPGSHVKFTIHLAGKVHNNKMERMNGEIRDRERVMRTLEKADTPILTGMQIFHNYVRPHMALNGKTPAEVAGIKIQGDNKWITIIQNASKKTRPE